MQLSLLCFAFTLFACSSKTVSDNSHGSSLSVSELKSMMKSDNNLVILDVRTNDEIAGGMIPNATHIDFYGDNFDEEIAKIDKASTVVVYCRSGGRAGKACDKLEELGVNKSYNLGGYSAWSEADKK